MPKSVKKGKKVKKSRSKTPTVGKAREPRPKSVYEGFTPSVYNGFNSERSKSVYSGFEKSIKSNEWGFGDSANRSTVKASSPKKSSAKASRPKLPANLMASIHSTKASSPKKSSAKASRPKLPANLMASIQSKKPSTPKKSSAKASRPKLPANLMASIHTKKSASVKSVSVKKSSAEKVEQSANKEPLPKRRPQAAALLLDIADQTKGKKSLKSTSTSNEFKKELQTLKNGIEKTIQGVPDSNTELKMSKSHVLKFVDKILIDNVTPTKKNVLKYKATFAAYVLEYLKYMLKNKTVSTQNKKILSDTLLEFYKSDTDLFVKVRQIKSKPVLSLIKSQDSDFNSIDNSNNSTKSSEVRLNVNAISESEK